MAQLFTAFPSLAERWAKDLKKSEDEIPWTVARKPLRESTVALITTGGIHLRSQTPFDMSDGDGDPSFREISIDTPFKELVITHDYYTHRDADLDPNLVLPIVRLQKLVDNGCIGALHSPAYSFMGHIDGLHVKTLTEISGPQVAESIQHGNVDYALLVPA